MDGPLFRYRIIAMWIMVLLLFIVGTCSVLTGDVP
jgi:hypothetical protein